MDSNSVWKKVVGMLHEIRHQLTPAGHTLISVVGQGYAQSYPGHMLLDFAK